MLSLQINKILKGNPVTKDIYVGCFPSDLIPRSGMLFPHCFCVNTSTSMELGEHWVAIFVSTPNSVEYYDSFGDWPPVSGGIVDYLVRFQRIRFNRNQFQSERSSMCGKHVIYFLHMRSKGIPFERIIRRLLDCRTKPDVLVSNFVDQLEGNIR